MKFGLNISNFRSIKEQSLDVLPITILYGPNGAGKSSAIYALMTMRNIVTNPNRNMDSFFSYGGINLGSLGQVFRKRAKEEFLQLCFTVFDKTIFSYRSAIGSVDGAVSGIKGYDGLLKEPFDVATWIPFPYSGNEAVDKEIATVKGEFIAVWNGITFSALKNKPADWQPWEVNRMLRELNAPIHWLGSIAYAPPIRGFTKAQHNLVPLTSPWATTEDEIASVLYNDKHLVSRVSVQLEKLTNRDLRVSPVPGTGIFSLDTIDKTTGMNTELVNEGFGINQMAYLLAVCLKDDSKIICIEEPEIHLHSSSIRLFARALAEMARDSGKHFILTTQSEVFVSSFLSMVAEGSLDPETLACYLTTKTDNETVYERQAVNGKGQIEGGLTSFMEAELANIHSLLEGRIK